MSMTCPICFDEKKERKFLNLSCQCKACVDCVSQWVTLQIAEKHHTIDRKTACPIYDCKNEIRWQEIYQKLPLSSQLKMGEALLQIYFSRQKDIRKCPNSSCNYAGTINMQKSCTSPLQCDACGIKWREKENYTTFEKILDYLKNYSNANIEELSENWIKQKSKQCPSCKVSIEKNGGCYHMTCKYCSYQFCWICLQKYPAHSLLPHLYHKYVLLLKKTLLVLIAIFLGLSSVFGIMTALSISVSFLVWIIRCTFYGIIGFPFFLKEELFKLMKGGKRRLFMKLIGFFLEVLCVLSST